jgi:hypothetical protein
VRDRQALPAALVAPVGTAVAAVRARVATPPTPAPPMAVVPGSIGHWGPPSGADGGSAAESP